MSDELVTTTKVNLRQIPDELKDVDKKIMFEQYVKGLTLKEVAESYGCSYRTILRYAKDGNWNAEKEVRLEELKEAEIVSNKDVLASESVDRALRGIYKLATDFENAVILGKESPVNYKQLVDAMDKLVRLRMHVDSGGVTKSEVNVKKQVIDWNKLIELSVDAKKAQGDAFDEKAFIKRVIDAEVIKKDDKK